MFSAFPDGCHMFQEDWNYFVYRKGFKVIENNDNNNNNNDTNNTAPHLMESDEVTRVSSQINLLHSV